MNMLFKYDYVLHTTAEYIRRAAELDHNVLVSSTYNNINETIKNKKIDLLFEIESNGVSTDTFTVNIPSVLWTLDTHLNLPIRTERAKLFDYVFCPHKQHVEKIAQEKLAYWLPYACDPTIHKDHHLERIYDITFVGHVHRDQYGNTFPIHDERGGILKHLTNNFKLNQREGLYLEAMAKEYSQSKVIFNSSVRNDINMRIFEAMACGGCLVTSWLTKETGIQEMFPFGTIDRIDGRKDCFLMYRNGEELVLLVKILLQEDKLRETIAKNGYEAVQEHTYKSRLERILEVVGEKNGERRLPKSK